MKYFLTALSVLFFSCSDNPKKSSSTDTAAVRYDGLYVSKKSGGNDDYYSYLKFYKNGTVITVSSSGTPEEISKWFTPDHELVNKGGYKVDEDQINFTAKGKNGSVKYSGTITNEEKLKLHSKSLINDYEADVTYSFVEE